MSAEATLAAWNEELEAVRRRAVGAKPGVSRPEHTELVARTLGALGAERAWVVHGADGLDEISTTGYTKVSECRGGAVHTLPQEPQFCSSEASTVHTSGQASGRFTGQGWQMPERQSAPTSMDPGMGP